MILDHTLTVREGDTIHILITDGNWYTFCNKQLPPGDTSIYAADCDDCISAFAALATKNL